MIHNVGNELWFDNERMNIIRGSENLVKYNNNLNSFDRPIDITLSDKQFVEAPTIIFMSSLHCNLKCTYCYAHKGEYRSDISNRSFKASDYIIVFDETIKKYGLVKAVTFFGGEPLLNHKEIEIFLKQVTVCEVGQVPKINFSITGTLFTPITNEPAHSPHLVLGHKLIVGWQ